MKRFLILLVMAACAGSLLFAQQAAGRNTRYVSVQSVSVKDSTGFFAKELGNLPLGTEVTLLRDEGKWSEVRAGNLSGWVASSSLSARRVAASNSTVATTELALAGKGFSPDMEVEYRKSGLDYSRVDSMERMVISTEDLRQFVTEGRLAGGE